MSDTHLKTRVSITGTRSGKLRARIKLEGHTGHIEVTLGSEAWVRRRGEFGEKLYQKILNLAEIFTDDLQKNLERTRSSTPPPPSRDGPVRVCRIYKCWHGQTEETESRCPLQQERGVYECNQHLCFFVDDSTSVKKGTP